MRNKNIILMLIFILFCCFTGLSLENSDTSSVGLTVHHYADIRRSTSQTNNETLNAAEYVEEGYGIPDRVRVEGYYNAIASGIKKDGRMWYSNSVHLFGYDDNGVYKGDFIPERNDTSGFYKLPNTDDPATEWDYIPTTASTTYINGKALSCNLLIGNHTRFHIASNQACDVSFNVAPTMINANGGIINIHQLQIGWGNSLKHAIIRPNADRDVYQTSHYTTSQGNYADNGNGLAVWVVLEMPTAWENIISGDYVGNVGILVSAH